MRSEPRRSVEHRNATTLSEHGIGFVTAGKLMARKRPRLIPVYDDVVKCALDEPQEV